VLARAPAPLVHAQLPWELTGFTDLVVYSEGIKPIPGQKDAFIVYAGGGDRVVEAFSIRVDTKTPKWPAAAAAARTVLKTTDVASIRKFIRGRRRRHSHHQRRTQRRKTSETQRVEAVV